MEVRNSNKASETMMNLIKDQFFCHIHSSYLSKFRSFCCWSLRGIATIESHFCPKMKFLRLDPKKREGETPFRHVKLLLNIVYDFFMENVILLTRKSSAKENKNGFPKISRWVCLGHLHFFLPNRGRLERRWQGRIHLGLVLSYAQPHQK